MRLSHPRCVAKSKVQGRALQVQTELRWGSLRRRWYAFIAPLFKFAPLPPIGNYIKALRAAHRAVIVASCRNSQGARVLVKLRTGSGSVRVKAKLLRYNRMSCAERE